MTTTLRRSLVLGLGATVVATALAGVPSALFAGGGSAASPAKHSAKAASAAKAAEAKAKATYASLPMSFVANRGQADPAVKFSARTSNYTAFLTQDEAVFSLASPTKGGADEVVRMRLHGASADAPVNGDGPQGAKANYFVGNDPSRWVRGAPSYGRVAYSGVYPGIDLVYYGKGKDLEYDFVVAPGADPTAVSLGFSGAKAMRIDAGGDLVLDTASGSLRQHRPVAYQDHAGTRRSVPAQFLTRPDGSVGFSLGAYDSRLALVIDPVLVYVTKVGGSSSTGLSGFDTAADIALNSLGEAYITGETRSANFPTTAGAVDTTHNGGADAFVAKLSATGALVYSTFVGGSNDEAGRGLVLDASNNAYVAGSTTSTDFPTTTGAYDTTHNGGTDAFVFKLNATGTALGYSTYLGTTGSDVGNAISVTGTNAYVTGQTNSAAFPMVSAYDTTLGGTDDAFVTKLNIAGTALVYSTYLGGSGLDAGGAIATDADGKAHVTGSTVSTDFPTVGAYDTSYNGGDEDAFVTKLNAAGSGLDYSTYLGGSTTSGGLGNDRAYDIAVSGGKVYVAGATESYDFPVTANAYQATLTAGGGGHSASLDLFVTKLDPAAGAAGLMYSSYLGGGAPDFASGLAVDTLGFVYLTGQTTSGEEFAPGFDIKPPPQNDPPGTANNVNAFVSKFDTLAATGAASLVYSTYLGGTLGDFGDAIAVDAAGNAYVAGDTESSSFTWPTSLSTTCAGGTTCGGYDAFVAKVAPN